MGLFGNTLLFRIPWLSSRNVRAVKDKEEGKKGRGEGGGGGGGKQQEVTPLCYADGHRQRFSTHVWVATPKVPFQVGREKVRAKKKV